MTPSEQRRFVENFKARRTSRVANLQNGFADVIGGMQFDAGDAPMDTTKVDAADVGDPDFDGSVPMERSNDDSPIYGAIDILQKHIESLGNADLLNIWASTSDALKKTVSGDGIQKAIPNDGPTRDALVVNDNNASSRAGSHGYIPTSELQRMETEAAKLTKLSARICNVKRL